MMNPGGRIASLALRVGSVARACQLIGQRGSYLAALLSSYGDAQALPAIAHGEHAGRRMTAEEARVVVLAIEQPCWDQIQLANAVDHDGLALEPPAIHSVLLRYGLGSTRRRLAAVVAEAACHGISLTEPQVLQLQRAIAASHAGLPCDAQPGQCGLQDTYWIGQVEGLGAVYQQTFVDPAANVVFAKLYWEKSARSAADLLEEQVLPWYRRAELPLRRIMTDRGTEYCGYVRRHVYEGALRARSIEHRWTQEDDPQHHPVCRRLHLWMHRELYRRLLLDRDYRSFYDLQRDLDHWLDARFPRRCAAAGRAADSAGADLHDAGALAA